MRQFTAILNITFRGPSNSFPCMASPPMKCHAWSFVAERMESGRRANCSTSERVLNSEKFSRFRLDLSRESFIVLLEGYGIPGVRVDRLGLFLHTPFQTFGRLSREKMK